DGVEAARQRAHGEEAALDADAPGELAPPQHEDGERAVVGAVEEVRGIVDAAALDAVEREDGVGPGQQVEPDGRRAEAVEAGLGEADLGRGGVAFEVGQEGGLARGERRPRVVGGLEEGRLRGGGRRECEGEQEGGEEEERTGHGYAGWWRMPKSSVATAESQAEPESQANRSGRTAAQRSTNTKLPPHAP